MKITRRNLFSFFAAAPVAAVLPAAAAATAAPVNPSVVAVPGNGWYGFEGGWYISSHWDGNFGDDAYVELEGRCLDTASRPIQGWTPLGKALAKDKYLLHGPFKDGRPPKFEVRFRVCGGSTPFTLHSLHVQQYYG